MPIATLTQRPRELGRIRIGRVVGDGDMARPERLDRFRLTSTSEQLLTDVSIRYGGLVEPWQPLGGGQRQWEVVVAVARLPILLPPQPVTAWLELWTAAGVQRRCDGITEQSGQPRPCLCGPDRERRICKPSTRLNVVLAELRGLGVWRLESHGWAAAAELPGVAELLSRAGDFVPAWLGLEERQARKNGATHRFVVPVIEVDVSPAELMAGPSSAPTITTDRPARAAELPAGGPLAIEAPRPREVAMEPVDGDDPCQSFLEDLAQAVSVEECRAVYAAAVQARLLGAGSPATARRDELATAIADRACRFAEHDAERAAGS